MKKRPLLRSVFLGSSDKDIEIYSALAASKRASSVELDYRTCDFSSANCRVASSILVQMTIEKWPHLVTIFLW